MNDQTEFGFINLETEKFHKGFIDANGQMAYKVDGEKINQPGLLKQLSTPPPIDTDPVITSSSWMEGPRWGGIPEFLQKVAIHYGLKISLRENKGWIRTTVFYDVTGRKSSLKLMNSAIQNAIAEYER